MTESIDTTTSGGKLVFPIFAALAEFERTLIRERTRAGLIAARARGRQGGRVRNNLGTPGDNTFCFGGIAIQRAGAGAWLSAFGRWLFPGYPRERGVGGDSGGEPADVVAVSLKRVL